MKNNKMIKDLYVCNEKLYNLFKHLVTFIPDSEPLGRLKILDMFFLIYKYPKLEEFAANIECHNGEEGPHYANMFIRDNYEMFLKENDPELYSIFRNAEDIWCNQSGIEMILKDGIDTTEPKKCVVDDIPF